MPSEEYFKEIKQKIKEAGEKQLKELDLSGSFPYEEKKLIQIPGEVYELEHLEVLYLSYNRLTTVPESISKLQNLEKLGLKDNPIETPPPEVLEKGVSAIKNYFRQMQAEGKDYLYEAKLLIVGEAGAGKTTLAKKIDNKDYVLKEDEQTTEGIDVIKWEFPWPGNMPHRYRTAQNLGHGERNTGERYPKLHQPR
jgi:flagellar biosynthesis GTPase FlhF